jgi:hypothetical protein
MLHAGWMGRLRIEKFLFQGPLVSLCIRSKNSDSKTGESTPFRGHPDTVGQFVRDFRTTSQLLAPDEPTRSYSADPYGSSWRNSYFGKSTVRTRFNRYLDNFESCLRRGFGKRQSFVHHVTSKKFGRWKANSESDWARQGANTIT